jgi:hypothetical protein
VVALLCSAKAMVRVVGAQPTGFWGLWCRFVAGAVVGGRNGCAVVGWWLVMDLVMPWWRW